MGYSESTYYFFGARLTDEQHEIACEQDYGNGVECVLLGDCSGGDVTRFLAASIHDVTIEDAPLALDAMPVVPLPKLRTLLIALEDLGVKEEPRWWLGVSGG